MLANALERSPRIWAASPGRRSHQLHGVEWEGSGIESLARFINQYGSNKNLEATRRIHAYIANDSRHCNNIFLANTLIHSYGRCNRTVEARGVFERAELQRNIFSWNILSAAYIHNGCLWQAKFFFDVMPQRNSVSWNQILAAFGHLGLLDEAVQVFRDMPESNSLAWNSLLSAYSNVDGETSRVFRLMPCYDVVTCNTVMSHHAKRGEVDECRELFDEVLLERSLISWTCLMQAFAASGDWPGACTTFHRMPMHDLVAWTALLQSSLSSSSTWLEAERVFQSMPVQDEVTSSLMITACAHSGAVSAARAAFESAPRRNVSCWNALVQGYLHNERVEEAGAALERMSMRDLLSWNSLLSQAVQCGECERAREVLREMPEASVVSWATVVCGLSQCPGRWEEAEEVFVLMPAWNVVACNAMIACYGVEQAAALFQRMPFKDVVSWTTLLHAYAQLSLLDEAADTFGSMPHRNLVSWNAMLAAYVQSGRGCEAQELFERMPGYNAVSMTSMIGWWAQKGWLSKAEKVFEEGSCGWDLVTWNTLLGAYAHNGLASEAVELYRGMVQQGVGADAVSLTSVMNACSHLGEVEGARAEVRGMEMDHGVAPLLEHYVCMVDLLGRAGELAAAEELVKSMPVWPAYVAWSCLLGACKTQQDVERGLRAAVGASELQPTNCAPYVLLWTM